MWAVNTGRELLIHDHFVGGVYSSHAPDSIALYLDPGCIRLCKESSQGVYDISFIASKYLSLQRFDPSQLQFGKQLLF